MAIMEDVNFSKIRKQALICRVFVETRCVLIDANGYLYEKSKYHIHLGKNSGLKEAASFVPLQCNYRIYIYLNFKF